MRLERALETTLLTLQPSRSSEPVELALRQAVSKAQPDLVEVNEVAAELLRTQAADLIAGLSVTRKEVVRRVLAQGVRRGWSDTTVRRRVAQVVGLDPRRAAAVDKYRQGMLNEGVPAARAEKQAKAYAKRLTRERVALIADHEMRQALMSAQRLVWADMQANGDLSPYAVRVIRVNKDERLCTICGPLNGRRASLKADWNLGPPFHPRCRCDEEVIDLGIEKGEDVPVSIEKAVTPGGRVGDDSSLAKPGYKGPRRLAKYVRMVAHAMMRKGHSKSQAIRLARGIIENWATGKGDVSPKVRAAAIKALAEQKALDKGATIAKTEATTWNVEDYVSLVHQIEKDNL